MSGPQKKREIAISHRHRNDLLSLFLTGIIDRVYLSLGSGSWNTASIGSRTAPCPHPFLYSKGNSSAGETQVDCIISRSPFCCSWLFSTSKFYPPGTPRVYSTYLSSSGKLVDLEFIKLLGPSPLHLNPNPTLLFLQMTLRRAYSSSLWPQSVTVRQFIVRLLREALHRCSMGLLVWQEHRLRL